MPPDPERLAFYLLKAISKAHRLYRLFDEGDRIAVAVSGGKDSGALLELLSRWTGLPRFELVAVHVAASCSACAVAVSCDALNAWFARLGVASAIVPLDEQPAVDDDVRASGGPCFHCAWRRRKAIFLAAHQLGCNKVALAHHADDVAVTTLLNLVYQGRCETMPARLELFDGVITLIRPLYLVEERRISRFIESGILPFDPVTCAVGADGRRAYMTAVLRQLERESRQTKRSLLHAVEHGRSNPHFEAIPIEGTGRGVHRT